MWNVSTSHQYQVPVMALVIASLAAVLVLSARPARNDIDHPGTPTSNSKMAMVVFVMTFIAVYFMLNRRETGSSAGGGTSTRDVVVSGGASTLDLELDEMLQHVHRGMPDF